MARKKSTPTPTPETAHQEPADFWPALLDQTYHPDIANALHHLPFTPPHLTQDSTTTEETEANAEIIDAAGAQLYEHLRRPHMQVDSVYKLINAARAFMSARRKFLNLEKNDLSDAIPVKPKVTSLG